jgi:translation initiation factor RLI1
MARPGIAHLADRQVTELSGGERQLMLVACALALREVTDILRFRMLMTTADCENAKFCAMAGVKPLVTPSSSLLLVSNRRENPPSDKTSS